MAKDKIDLRRNVKECDVTTQSLKMFFDSFPCKAYIDDDGLFIEVDEIDAPILVSINHDAKYISFSCIFDVSKTTPYQAKLLIVNEVNNSIPFIKFILPPEGESNDCVYTVSDLGFIGGMTFDELDRAIGSFIAALRLALKDSELYKLNG